MGFQNQHILQCESMLFLVAFCEYKTTLHGHELELFYNLIINDGLFYIQLKISKYKWIIMFPFQGKTILMQLHLIHTKNFVELIILKLNVINNN